MNVWTSNGVLTVCPSAVHGHVNGETKVVKPNDASRYIPPRDFFEILTNRQKTLDDAHGDKDRKQREERDLFMASHHPSSWVRWLSCRPSVTSNQEGFALPEKRAAEFDALRVDKVGDHNMMARGRALARACLWYPSKGRAVSCSVGHIPRF